MMDKFDEYRLWIKFKGGDNNALSALYSLYINQLYSYGIKISGNEHIVMDCIQEIFLNLVDKRQVLLISEKTHLYLFKSLRNKIIEEIRSQTRKRIIEESLVSDIINQSRSAEEFIVSVEEENFQKKTINSAIESLTERQREAIFLKFTEDLSYEDIAIVLDIDIASVRTLIYRTLKKMKKSIVRKGVFLFSLFHNLKFR